MSRLSIQKLTLLSTTAHLCTTNRLKAFTSVAVLGMSILAGLEKMNPRTLIIVLAIS